jgi:hypothetical protein
MARAAVKTSGKEFRQPKELPAPNGDFYEVTELLDPEELVTLNRVPAFHKENRSSTSTGVEGAFQFELLPKFPKRTSAACDSRVTAAAAEARCFNAS